MTVVIRLLALRPGHVQLLPACAKFSLRVHTSHVFIANSYDHTSKG